MARKVEVTAPKKIWVEQFEQEKLLLEKIFIKERVEIYHIGSTAIKNIKAKPIIDILIVVKDIQKIDAYNQVMRKNGYDCLGENGILNRRFFTKGGESRSHHIHVFQEDNVEIKRHLLFRDFMNSHPEEAMAYSQLKAELAKKFPYDIEAYVEGKDAFIKTIDRNAKLWYNETNKENN